jgi:hypothetical protein
MKAALRIGLAGILVVVSAGTPLVLQRQTRLELNGRERALDQQASRLSLLAAENGRLSNLVAQATASPAVSTEQLRELMRLRNERRWLAEQTNLLARLVTGTPEQPALPPAELESVLCAEMVAAMKRILPALQPALQRYALAHSNQVPESLSELQDYFPLVAGRKMPGLQTFEFVRDEGPRPGDALVLRGSAGRPSGNGSEVRVYGFSDGRVVEVSSEDGQFDAWEAQHLGSAPAGTEGRISIEAREPERPRRSGPGLWRLGYHWGFRPRIRGASLTNSGKRNRPSGRSSRNWRRSSLVRRRKSTGKGEPPWRRNSTNWLSRPSETKARLSSRRWAWAIE